MPQLQPGRADRAAVAFRNRISARPLGLASVAAACLFVAQSLIFLFNALGVGIDFTPLRDAGTALLHGRSVYSDPSFVYPPTAAPLFVPLGFGSSMVTYVVWLITGVVALALAAGLVARAATPTFRLPVFAGGLLALVCGTAAAHSLFLGNLSVLLAPVAVGILLAFHRQRWLLGCALLAASLLVKPLLAPLLLVPAVRRRWWELVRTMLPAAGLLALSMLVVPGGNHFGRILSYCLSGTNLHGQNAVNNLSIRGWVEAQHAPASWGTIGSAVLVVVVLTRLVEVAVRRGLGAISPVWLANLLLLTTLLAGRISEVHFLLTVLATLLLQLVLEKSWFNLMLAAPGLIMLALPIEYLDLVVSPYQLRQNWLVGAELCLLAALVLSRRPEPRMVRLPPLLVIEPELALA